MSRETIIPSALGPVRLVADAKGMRCIGFCSSQKKKEPASELLRQCARELAEYFDGRRKKFFVRLAWEGTVFQKKVWTEICRIPYGKTVTYSEIAARIGHQKAARAVGTAAGANPLCLIVPCHRVVAVKGLGGYAYGLLAKKKLLKHERDVLNR